MSKTLTKQALTEYLTEALGFPKVLSRECVDAFFEEISCALERGENVKLPGFGNFSIRDKAARPGRNPITMEPVMIEARRVVTWAQGHKLTWRILGNVRADEMQTEDTIEVAG